MESLNQSKLKVQWQISYMVFPQYFICGLVLTSTAWCHIHKSKKSSQKPCECSQLKHPVRCLSWFRPVLGHDPSAVQLFELRSAVSESAIKGSQLPPWTGQVSNGITQTYAVCHSLNAMQSIWLKQPGLLSLTEEYWSIICEKGQDIWICSSKFIVLKWLRVSRSLSLQSI